MNFEDFNNNALVTPPSLEIPQPLVPPPLPLLPKDEDVLKVEEKPTNPKIPVKFTKFEDEDGEVVFVVNNWVENKNNPTLLLLDQKGASVWMHTDGTYSFRRTPNGKVQYNMQKSKLIPVLTNLLKKVVTFNDTSEDPNNIKSFDLKMVSEDTFTPFVNQEFYEKDGETFRNTFRQTKYMTLKKGGRFKEAKAIMSLLLNLTNNNKERREWVVNWLAYFFQGLKKSPVAWVAKGSQGSGKGILYDEILVYLFGEKQCIQVNDKTMKGNFLGGVVEKRLVINLDEISSGIKSNQEFKNQLKAIVSNKAGTFEKKNITTDDVTELFAMIFITTNEPQALEVEHSDRRFAIFSTGPNLSELNFLGYGTYQNLIDAIKDELEDFALMLLNYDVNVKLATTAQDSPEKEALVGSTTDRFQTFVIAIKKKDLEYFEDLKHIDPFLYQELVTSFSSNRLSKKKLKEYFNRLEDENISAKRLMTKLRTIDAFFFNEQLGENGNAKGCVTGDKFFILDSKHNEYHKKEIFELDIEADIS